MKKRRMKQYIGFTLIEIMVVITLIGIMTGFGIPKYIKTINIAYEKDAITVLKQIHAASKIYYARNGEYWAGATSLSDINTNLKLNIYPNNFTLIYIGNATGFSCSISSNAQNPELGVIDPDHSSHPIVKRFANNYLGMSTYYGFENPSEKWQKIAYTESSNIPIILESNIGYGKMVTVSISNLTKYYLQKFHYSTLFRNIINYSLDYSVGQEERKKEFFD